MPRVSAGKLIPRRLTCAEDFTLQLKVLLIEQTGFDDVSIWHQKVKQVAASFLQKPRSAHSEERYLLIFASPAKVTEPTATANAGPPFHRLRIEQWQA